MIRPRRRHRIVLRCNGAFALSVAVMPRLTITLSDDRHRALKQAAARRNTSIRRIIEESLDFYGVRTVESATALVATAGERSELSDDEAMALAVDETRAERQR